MKHLFEGSDYSDLRREMEVLRKRIEDLESGQARSKAAGRATCWRRLARRPALAVAAVTVAVLLALGVLGADNKQDPLFIDQNGNVGINQTKPESPLDVNGNALFRGSVNLGNSVLYFTNTDHRTSATALQVGIAAIENSMDRAALELFGRATPTRGRVVAISDRLGIGTNYPNATLDVGGDAVVNGVLTVDHIQGILTTALDPASQKESRLLRIEGTTIVKGGEIRGALWGSRVYEWNQGGSSITMTKADHSACFLTSVTGLFAGTGASVEIKREGNYWVLTGTSERAGARARARCIGAPDDAW